MKRMLVYVDSSVVGGCEDEEFASDSKALWGRFVDGRHVLVISAHTLRELEAAPEAVRQHLLGVPTQNQILLEDSEEAYALADAYLARGIVGPGSRSDAQHHDGAHLFFP